MAFPSLTKTVRNTSYAAISPTLPELSQKGHNILISGGGSGIGRATALSFAQAEASHVALLGRNLAALEESKRLIDALESSTQVHLFVADITDEIALEKAFDGFVRATGGPIHVLVANAGINPGIGKSTDMPGSAFSKGFVGNAMGTINTVHAYMRHLTPEADHTGYKGRIIHTTAGNAHCTLPMSSTYSISKLASTKYLEYVAMENPEVQVINYYPGMVDTAMNKEAVEAGMVLDPKDDISLASDFTVWAASPKSAFLGSGRFIWAAWDVDELEERFGRIKSGEIADGALAMGVLPVNQQLTIGLVGWC